MKLKFTLLTVIGFLAFSAAAQAGPFFSISFGSGGCYQRPVYYSQPYYRSYRAPVYNSGYYYRAPVRYSRGYGYDRVVRGYRGNGCWR